METEKYRKRSEEERVKAADQRLKDYDRLKTVDIYTGLQFYEYGGNPMGPGAKISIPEYKIKPGENYVAFVVIRQNDQHGRVYKLTIKDNFISPRYTMEEVLAFDNLLPNNPHVYRWESELKKVERLAKEKLGYISAAESERLKKEEEIAFEKDIRDADDRKKRSAVRTKEIDAENSIRFIDGRVFVHDNVQGGYPDYIGDYFPLVSYSKNKLKFGLGTQYERVDHARSGIFIQDSFAFGVTRWGHDGELFVSSSNRYNPNKGADFFIIANNKGDVTFRIGRGYEIVFSSNGNIYSGNSMGYEGIRGR